MKEKIETKVKHHKSYGNKLGYSIFQFVLKYLGLNFAYAILFSLIPYYMIFRPGVYRRSKPYLMRRFPNDNFILRYIRLFKYTFIFGQTLIDQYYFSVIGESRFVLHFDREPEILDLVEKKPVIFLMSHVGFWEAAFHGSRKFNKKLNIMIDNDFEKEKRKSYYDIHRKEGKLALINVTDDFGGLIEAVNALLRGEVVGVTGDRAQAWRSKTATFLGSPAKFPVIAEQLAVATGAPVIAFLTSREKRYHIHFSWKDISSEILENNKLGKEEKIQKMLELYSRELEKHLQDHPYMWFNFFDFWET